MDDSNGVVGDEEERMFFVDMPLIQCSEYSAWQRDGHIETNNMCAATQPEASSQL